MCSGSEAGSYLRLIDFVYHSTLGLRVIKRNREGGHLDNNAVVVLRVHHHLVKGSGFRNGA